MARCSLQGVRRAAALSQARNSTIQRREPGVSLAALIRHEGRTRRTCSTTARCWSPEVAISRARNSTIRRLDPGPSPAASTEAGLIHTATLLTNGKVLIAGGDDTDCTSAELYDPAAGTWSLTGSLNDGRYFHTATLLPDGTVLAAGGFLELFWIRQSFTTRLLGLGPSPANSIRNAVTTPRPY